MPSSVFLKVDRRWAARPLGFWLKYPSYEVSQPRKSWSIRADSVVGPYLLILATSREWTHVANRLVLLAEMQAQSVQVQSLSSMTFSRPSQILTRSPVMIRVLHRTNHR